MPGKRATCWCIESRCLTACFEDSRPQCDAIGLPMITTLWRTVASGAVLNYVPKAWRFQVVSRALTVGGGVEAYPGYRSAGRGVYREFNNCRDELGFAHGRWCPHFGDGHMVRPVGRRRQSGVDDAHPVLVGRQGGSGSSRWCSGCGTPAGAADGRRHERDQRAGAVRCQRFSRGLEIGGSGNLCGERWGNATVWPLPTSGFPLSRE